MTPTTDQPQQPAAGLTASLPEVIGRYRILGHVGSGGMGTVYKAHDPHLDRTVALKLPRFDGPAPDRRRRVQRFQREARTAAGIWHPHVCPIYDVGEQDGQPFVVMPFIEGQSLAERLASKGRYEEVRAAVALVLQVCDALEAVHGHEVIHRDLKDGNILLDSGGRAILTDFGLARPENDAEHLTSEGVILGTPSFMAPEVAAGRTGEVGPWTDLYSLGVVLYRMLTGRLPFEGPALAVLGQIVHDDPVPPSRWRPDLSRDLESIVLRAMAREPRRRYQTAREFAQALADWRSGEAALPSRGEKLLPGRPPEARESATVPVAAGLPAGRRKQSWPGPFVTLLFATAALLLVVGLGIQLAGMAGVSHLFWGAGRPTHGSAGAEAKAQAAELLREVQKGHLVNVDHLLRKGVDPNVKDENGETALMKAAERGDVDLVKRLLQMSMLEVNEIDKGGETALMKAAASGQAGVVELLLQDANRIAVNLRDDRGRTALGKAIWAQDQKIEGLLRRAGGKE